MNFYSKKVDKIAVSHASMIAVLLAVLVFSVTTATALPVSDDERYVEKEFSNPSPGGHELASWLIAQLRQSSNQVTGNAVTSCRYPSAAKRNSEIINALLRLPKEMDNGRK